jgi:serine O-acetyltransferase
MDHATSIVVGETAVVENDVSMLHEVTLGGTGKEKEIAIQRYVQEC